MSTISIHHLPWEDGRYLRWWDNDQAEANVKTSDYVHVLTYEAREIPLYEGDPRIPYNVLEHAFREFNEGDFTVVGSLAWHYRRAGRAEDELGNRSLCTGDVVVVDDRAYACMSLGWADVTEAWKR